MCFSLVSVVVAGHEARATGASISARCFFGQEFLRAPEKGTASRPSRASVVGTRYSPLPVLHLRKHVRYRRPNRSCSDYGRSRGAGDAQEWSVDPLMGRPMQQLTLLSSHRQAMAPTEDGFPTQSWPDDVREACCGEESACCCKGKGEGIEGREGG